MGPTEITTDATASRVSSKIGLIVACAGFFGFLGVTTSFFPLWLAGHDLDDRWIATCSAAIMLSATTGQIILPYGALWTGARAMAALAASAAIVATSILSLTAAGNPVPVFVAAVLAGFFTGALIPLWDALALALAQTGVNYGGMRAAGSISFAASTVITGWVIDRGGTIVVIPIEAVLLLLCLIGILLVKEMSALSASTARDRPKPRGLWLTLRRGDVWLLMLSVALINAGHAYYYLFANLHWTKRLGYSASTIGLLWAVGVAAEVAVLFYFGSRHGLRWATGLIFAGAFAGMVRWSASALDPPLLLLFCLQTLHGFTFGATLVGGMQALRVLVAPRELPTVLGIFAAMVHGLVIGVVTLALGASSGARDASGFVLMAILSAIGGAAALCFALAARRQGMRAG